MAKPNLLRVTQMNAIYLDNEIYKTFIQIIQDSLKHLPPGITAPFEPEMNLIIRLALLYSSIWKNNSTFGQQLLSIKYDRLSNTKKILYLLGNSLEYIKNRFELWKPSHPINSKLHKINMLLVVFNFINISIFLRNGVKPLLIERVLGLNQVFESETVQRQFESKYMARELLWNGFIDILVNVLPLINYHKIKRTVRHYNPFHKKSIYTSVVSNRNITMHSLCAHCGQSPILPHHMNCAHIFCYVCLKGNQAADSKYECPICEHRNPNVLCEPILVI